MRGTPGSAILFVRWTHAVHGGGALEGLRSVRAHLLLCRLLVLPCPAHVGQAPVSGPGLINYCVGISRIRQGRVFTLTVGGWCLGFFNFRLSSCSLARSVPVGRKEDVQRATEPIKPSPLSAGRTCSTSCTSVLGFVIVEMVPTFGHCWVRGICLPLHQRYGNGQSISSLVVVSVVQSPPCYVCTWLNSCSNTLQIFARRTVWHFILQRLAHNGAWHSPLAGWNRQLSLVSRRYSSQVFSYDHDTV